MQQYLTYPQHIDLLRPIYSFLNDTLREKNDNYSALHKHQHGVNHVIMLILINLLKIKIGPKFSKLKQFTKNLELEDLGINNCETH